MREPCLGHRRTQMCVSEHMEEDTDLCVRVCLQADHGVIFCNTPSFISGLVGVQVVGSNVVQMGDAQHRVARFFPAFWSNQSFANKSREDFHSSADKNLAFQVSGGNRERARPQCYTLFLLKRVIDSLERISSTKLGVSLERTEQRRRDLAKQHSGKLLLAEGLIASFFLPLLRLFNCDGCETSSLSSLPAVTY